MTDTGEIIIIDDDQDDLLIYIDALQSIKVSHSINTFGSALEFLDYLKASTRKIFFILCDINMPIMNGIELRKALWDDIDLRQKATPFIFYSTASNVKNVTEAYLLPVQGYFQKASSYEGVKEQLGTIVNYMSHSVGG